MTPTFKLITIRFSHYNEKARWALDRFGVPYREYPMMPVLHFAPAMWVSWGKGKPDRQSSRFSTPILKTDRGEVICDSHAIVKYVSDRLSNPENTLYPNAEAANLEKYYNEYLAPHTRCFGYFNVLHNRKLAFYLADRNVPKRQARLFKLLFPLCRGTILGRLVITPERVEKAKGYIRKEFAAVEQLLSDGRNFITGSHFSAADLSFACASAPALLVQPEEGYGGALPPLGMASPEAAALARELRVTVTGKFVLRLFQKERGLRQIPASPALP